MNQQQLNNLEGLTSNDLEVRFHFVEVILPLKGSLVITASFRLEYCLWYQCYLLTQMTKLQRYENYMTTIHIYSISMQAKGNGPRLMQVEGNSVK